MTKPDLLSNDDTYDTSRSKRDEMVRVSADAFLAKVTELYEQRTGGAKGAIAISCKSGASCVFSRGV